VRAWAHRIGLYRVAAAFIGCALVVEILRVQVLPRTTAAAVACTMAEVLFLALAAACVVLARRPPGR
jgi:hypothetical protein